MKPELENLLLHYGVKGMKWRDVKDRTDEISSDIGNNIDDDIDEAISEAKKLGKKVSNLDDIIKKYGKKGIRDLQKRYDDYQIKRYYRKGDKEAMRAMKAAMANGGKLPKGYKINEPKKPEALKREERKIAKAMAKAFKDVAKKEKAKKQKDINDFKLSRVK